MLQQETEGNVFFLVEVVRALAEDAGQLLDIDSQSLPETVFTGGMQAIIRRRLDKVPSFYQPLLVQTAAAGRELDLNLVENLNQEFNGSNPLDIEHWLAACNESAIFEVEGNSWQFAHDKLREGLLVDLTPQERVQVHHQVGSTLESIYPDDPSYAEALTNHWHLAGNQEKERQFASTAGTFSASQYANQKAIRFFNRALRLTPLKDETSRFNLILAREEIQARLGDQAAQKNDLELLNKIAVDANVPKMFAETALRRSKFNQVIGEYEAAIQSAKTAVTWGQKSQVDAHLIVGYQQWATALQRQGSLEQAQEKLNHALQICREANNLKSEGATLQQLGFVIKEKGDFAKAQQVYLDGLSIYQKIEDKAGEGELLNRLGILSRVQGDFDQAKQYFEASKVILEKIGAWYAEWEVHRGLGIVAKHQGLLDIAQSHYQESLALSRKINHKPGEAIMLNNVGQVAFALGKYREAIDYFEQSYTIYQMLEDLQGQAMTQNNMGDSYLHANQLQAAIKHFETSHQICNSFGDRLGAGLTLNNLGLAAYLQNDLDTATGYLSEGLSVSQQVGNFMMSGVLLSQAILAKISQEREDKIQAFHWIEPVLTYIERNPNLFGSNTSLRIFLYAAEILLWLGDQRGEALLKDAYDLLMRNAQEIEDNELRASFLQHIPENFDVIKLYQQKFPK